MLGLTQQEIAARLREATALLSDSEAIAARLPAEARDAYFELVHYPVAITDAAGDLQVEERADPLPDGAAGWHTIRVSVQA